MTGPASDPAKRRPLPFWDVPLTVALLLGGLYSATTSFAQAPDAALSLDQYLVSMGADHYTHASLAVGAAYASAGSQLFALVLAIGFCVPRLRTRRRAFWIALVSAAIGTIALLTFTLIALFGDPSLGAYLTTLPRQ